MLDSERQTELVESIVNLVLYLKEEERGTSENFLKFCREPKIKKKKNKQLLKIKVYNISKVKLGAARG